MKIAYLGGIKQGQFREQFGGYDKSSLEYEVKVELPYHPKIVGGAITITTVREYDIYHLKIIKKYGEIKHFYVLSTMTKDEIEKTLDSCWAISDNLGYDFN
ncbi:hypothetical protein [Acinetobacter junii]|uniref:hypothetical protein n=1 Tax=Acinetobacter junii TaxID=40215 RepID=UPI003017BBC8